MARGWYHGKAMALGAAAYPRYAIANWEMPTSATGPVQAAAKRSQGAPFPSSAARRDGRPKEAGHCNDIQNRVTTEEEPGGGMPCGEPVMNCLVRL